MQFEHFYPEAEEVVVRELAAIQQVKDCLKMILGLCLLHYQLIVIEIGEWLLDLIVHSLKALMEFLVSMTDTALARVEKISQAKLALLKATTLEEREKVLDAIHQLAERS